jgi:hypothetical protein
MLKKKVVHDARATTLTMMYFHQNYRASLFMKYALVSFAHNADQLEDSK